MRVSGTLAAVPHSHLLTTDGDRLVEGAAEDPDRLIAI